MNILQHSVFPNTSIYTEDIGLYLNASTNVRLIDNVLIVPPYQKVDLNTYFNYFSVKKWVDFGQIDSLYIRGNISGIAILEVIGVKKHQDRIQQILLLRRKIGAIGEWLDYYHDIDGFDDCDGVFVRICTLGEQCELGVLEFGTHKPIRRHVKLMICAFGGNNLKVFDEINQMAQHNGLQLEFFGNKILDNKNNQITPIIRCLEASQKFDSTHILTLATDGYISSESIFRAVRFFEMVFLERRDVLIVGHSLLNNNPMKSNYSLDIVLKGGSKNNMLNWSFCMFDKNIVQGYGLPLPISLNHSANEYRERIYKEIVPINGVAFNSLWQDDQNLLQTEYHDVRDGIICELLSSTPDLLKIKELIWDRFWHNIHTYQYVGARLNLYALDHLVKGTYQLSQADVERFLENLYHKENRFTKYVYINPYKQEQKPLTPIKGTLMNKLKPYLGMGKKDGVVVNERSRAMFVGRREVLVALGDGAEIARIRRKKAARLISHAAKSYYEFTKNHKQIKQTLLQYRNDKKSISN